MPGRMCNIALSVKSEVIINKLSCYSGICSWSVITLELQVPRFYNVAIAVPDYFCLEEQEGKTHNGTATSGSCVQFDIGDGYCDDINNNLSCNFDGGDCCGANINTDYCVECQCLEG